MTTKKTAMQEFVEWLEAQPLAKEGVTSKNDVCKGVIAAFTDCLFKSRQLLAEESKPTQRQDSLQDQLKTVRQLARENGCYDAEDWIVNMSGKTFSENTPSHPADNKGKDDKGLVEQIEKLLHEPCLAIDAWRKVERIKTVIAKFKEK